MDGRPLDHVELLTIKRKEDDYYRQWIGDDVQSLARNCLGVRTWIRFQSALTVMSRFAYFNTTALSKTSTLGEEFCNAKPIKTTPYKFMLISILNNTELQSFKLIPRQWLELIYGVHDVAFFLFQDFYELSKRLTNYSYFCPDFSNRQSSKLTLLYRGIGLMSLIKLMHNIVMMEETNVSSECVPNKSDTGTMYPTQTKICTKTMCQLCTSQRQDPTSTLCGHIFCWQCIHKWLKERSECPICRNPIDPSRLIHLINFI